MAVALGLVPVWYPKMANLALLPPQVAPRAVALGLVSLGLGPVWYPNPALMPPQVAPMAVALDLVSALLWLNCL